MKYLALWIAASVVLVAAPVVAQSQATVLTPTALFELIEKEQSARHKTTHVLLRQNERINELEQREAKVTAALSKRVFELEREVARLKTASILTHQALNKLRKPVK